MSRRKLTRKQRMIKNAKALYVRAKKQAVQSRAYILMPLLTMLLVLLWQMVIAPVAQLPYDQVSAAEGNLLSNSSFDEWQSRKPAGWQVKEGKGSKLEYNLSQVTGHIDGSGLYVEVGDYTNGLVEVISPSVTVQAGRNYFYKTFYKTDTDMALFVEFTDTTGREQRRYLKNLPDYDYDWSSMSTDIAVPKGVSSMRIMMHVNGAGFAEFDGAYVVERVAAEKKESVLVRNRFAGWSLQRSGVANVSAQLGNEVQSIVVSDYQTGNIGWESAPLPVEPHDYRRVDLTYSSNAYSEIWIEYELNSGEYVSWLVDIVPPSSEKTAASLYIESPSDAKAMQFSAQLADNGSLQTYDVVASLIAKPAAFSSPAVSVTFDDGWGSSKSNGAQILDELGFKATYYINPAYLGNSQYMTEDDVKELLASGYQIGSHTNTHIDISSYSQEKVEADMMAAAKYLKKRGIESADFASPYGKYDNNVLSYVMSLSNSHRGTEFGINTKQNFDKANLRALFIRKETTDTELRRALDMARRTNGWLILIYHKIEPSDSEFDVDKETFKRQMEIVKKSGIQVNTVGDVLANL